MKIKDYLLSDWKTVFIRVLSAAAFIAIGYFAANAMDANQSADIGRYDKNKEQGLRLEGYKYVNPLLECDIFDAQMTEKGVLTSLKSRIENRFKDEKLIDASAYFRDLNNGPWIGINHELKFTPASLLKVPIMIAYFKNNEQYPGFLDKKIKFKTQAVYEQNIKDDFPFVEGDEYKMSELVEIMITHSSNQAASLLLENIDQAVLQQVFKDFNVPDPAKGPAEDYMSVRDYAAFFRILYNASYLDKDDSEKALEILTKTRFKNGLIAGVPDDVMIAHKFGERLNVQGGENIKQLHDCGVVYAKEKRYVLCVMTRGKDFGDLEKAIKDVSNIVYDDFVMNK